jgi:hypothetical protein
MSDFAVNSVGVLIGPFCAFCALLNLGGAIYYSLRVWNSIGRLRSPRRMDFAIAVMCGAGVIILIGIIFMAGSA